MEFTKKDIIIYKKLKQKLSRDKIKKLIKNQDEFDLPDDVISVLRKFRVQDGGGKKDVNAAAEEGAAAGKLTGTGTETETAPKKKDQD